MILLRIKEELSCRKDKKNIKIMQNQPLVSFIITIYNTEPNLLRQCVESIMSLSLSQQEREIIIVDDGSEFTALNDLADLADDILYLRQRQQGLPSARNIGLRMSTGRFVQFVDGHDKLIRAPYEHCLDIARYHNPDIVLFKTTTKDNDIETPFTYDGPTTGSRYMRDHSICADVWGYLFERNILGYLKFDTHLQSADEDFTPQLFLRSERFYSTDSVAYHNRQTTESAAADSPTSQQPSFADTERILLHLQSLVVPEQDRAALNRRIAQLTMEHLCNIIRSTGDRQELEAATERLRSHGLYPLPDRDYTKRYKYFRKMMSNKITRNMLFVLIRR